MRVLVVNAGSATLKLATVEVEAGGGGEPVGTGDVLVDPWDGGDAGVAEALAELGPVHAVGHRVVHGGADLVAPALLDHEVVTRIRELTPLAPLHQPRAVAGIHAARAHLPDVPHVASFDTAFHASMPPAARTYALPAAWRERWGLQRFGFHGLSHAWASRRGPAVAGLAPGDARRTVVCHLGNGASLCAVLDGRSVDTTMGFTPLEGLVMGTRSGSVDPGLVLWLQTEAGLTAEEVHEGLMRRGGLAGLSGTGGDLRDVLAARAGGDGAAALAFDVFVHRLRQGVASMAASLGGLDLLVFTAGIGERSPDVRAATVDGLGFLGLALDPAANAAVDGDADITGPGASARTVVVAAREDLEVARQVADTVG